MDKELRIALTKLIGEATVLMLGAETPQGASIGAGTLLSALKMASRAANVDADLVKAVSRTTEGLVEDMGGVPVENIEFLSQAYRMALDGTLPKAADAIEADGNCDKCRAAELGCPLKDLKVKARFQVEAALLDACAGQPKN